MRRFFAIIIYLISLQSLAKADEIKDFEIEGISIGDSLLDYFSEDYINSNIKNNYFTHIKDKTFVAISVQDASFDVYDVMQFVFKRNNIEDCYRKIDKISEDISTNIKFINENKFKDLEMSANQGKYSGQTFFLSKGIISVHCYDWSEKIENENNWIDNLRINIKTDEFENFLQKG